MTCFHSSAFFSEISAGNIASDVCGFFSHTHKKGIISRSKEREREREREREKEKKQRRPLAKPSSDRKQTNVRMTLVSPLSSNRGGMLQTSTSTSTSSVLFRRRLVCSNSRSISRKLVPRRSNNSRTSSRPRRLSATTEEEASVRPSSSSSSRIQEAASADIGVVYKRFVKVRFVLEEENIHYSTPLLSS